MILWNNTKAAVAAVLAVAVVIGGVSAVVHAVVAQRSPQSRSVNVTANAAPTVPARPAVETVESQNLIFAVSPDRTALAGFAIATGEWQPMPDAPATIDPAGIVVAEITPQIRQALPETVRGGVIVAQVIPDSPASERLRVGDVIEEVNQEAVASVQDFTRAVAAIPRGGRA